MKRYSLPRQFRALPGCLAGVVVLFALSVSAQAQNIEGTYTGEFFSHSIVSTYKLTATEYSETVLFSIFNDQIGGNDIVYDLSEKTQSVPVKMEGGRIQFKLPFEPPSLVFEGDKIIATGPGGVDVWERVP